MKYSFQVYLFLIFACILGQSANVFGQNNNGKEREGPANIPFNIMEQVSADHDFTDQQILSISTTIFRDKNIKSGYYYYYPAEYSLNWVPGRGGNPYELTFNYGSGGQVTVTAIIKPKVRKNDIEIARKLLQQNLKGKEEAKYGIKGFLPMPVTDRTRIEFNNLSQFGIDENRVDVRPPSKLGDAIKMSFTTDRVEDLINMLFSDVGLYGLVLITPDGEDMQSSIPVNFNLKINDPGTYGRFSLTPSLWRKGWKNETDYPLQLNYLHIMREVGGKHIIYSWSMGKKEVPEKTQVVFKNASIIPAWVDNNPSIKAMWIEYTVKNCDRCNETVSDGFMDDKEHKEERKLRLTIQNPLEFTGADVIYINTRSYQADVNGSMKKELEVVEIRNDGGTEERGTFYVPAGGKMEYEYQVQVVTPEGKTYSTPGWVKGEGSLLVIGEALIKSKIAHYRLGSGVKDDSGGTRKRPNSKGSSGSGRRPTKKNN